MLSLICTFAEIPTNQLSLIATFMNDHFDLYVWNEEMSGSDHFHRTVQLISQNNDSEHNEISIAEK